MIMSYRINVAMSIGPNWNNTSTSYRHFFAVETDLIVSQASPNLKDLVDSLMDAYPAPAFNVTVSQLYNYSVDIEV
jgi:hypothetical protein